MLSINLSIDGLVSSIHKDVFQITGWSEAPYTESNNGSKQSHTKITQTYSGAIEETSECQYLMPYQPPNSAVFVGVETINGYINSEIHFSSQQLLISVKSAGLGM